jgi:hypothetical protein
VSWGLRQRAIILVDEKAIILVDDAMTGVDIGANSDMTMKSPEAMNRSAHSRWMRRAVQIDRRRSAVEMLERVSYGLQAHHLMASSAETVEHVGTMDPPFMAPRNSAPALQARDRRSSRLTGC